MLKAINFSRMVAYLEWLLLVKITWQSKKIIYPLTQCLWLSIGGIQWRVPYKVTRSFDHVVLQGHVNYFSCLLLLPQGVYPLNLAKWWLTIRKFNPLSPTTLWTRIIPLSRGDFSYCSNLEIHSFERIGTFQWGCLYGGELVWLDRRLT